MGMVGNVSIKDATKELAKGLKGNDEAKLLHLSAKKDVAAKFKKGPMYTATDGHSTWKVMYQTFDGQYLVFHIAEHH
jgi:hypothetical protein